MALAADATLANVNLSHPKTYYPKLVQCLKKCASKYGSAYVRIGTDGKGTTPYYLITADEEGNQIFGAFDYGHRFKHDPSRLHWSTKAMEMDEVIALAKTFL
jgi:hypothetical protein